MARTLSLRQVLAIFMIIVPSFASPAMRQRQVAKPVITAAPTPSPTIASLAARDTISTISTISVTGCGIFSDPEDNVDNVCDCANYDGYLPYTSGTSVCDYSVITVTNTQTNPYPYTSTAMNGGVTAYQWISPQGIYYESGEAVAAWTEYGGDTSVISTGTWVTAQMASSLSQNVGTKTGDELYTSISNILESACPSVTAPTGTNTAEPVSCTEEPGYLDGITYIDDWNDFKKDGILNLSISISAYWDNTARQTLIEGISQLINGTSLQPANTKETSWECDTCLDDEDWPTVNLTNIPQLSQVIYSDDIHTSNLLLTTEFEVESNGAYVCAIDAFVIDAMGALALIPGLEWLGIVAGGGAGMSFACLDGELS